MAVAFGAAADVAAVALLASGPLAPLPCGLAAVLHLAATAALLAARSGDASASRRALVAAFGFTIPIVGAAAAALSLRRREGDDAACELETGIAGDEHGDAAAAASAGPGAEALLIREVGEALSAPEALLVASVEQRRAMLWGLGRRADAEAIALLRWALTAASTEMGMEAALALEDLTIAFEKRLASHRRAVEEAPSCAAALAAAELLAHGFETGILDVTLIDHLAGEARRYCALAAELDREAACEVARARARFELAILRPDLALDAIDEALGDAAAPAASPLHAELRRLRADAALRANDLPWEGPSALLTYRRALPPRSTLHPRRGASSYRGPAGARQIA